ncbi:MAG: DAK2 domain-containing protein [Chloroflexi bacterium]|nr:DAK2 domain-containing protein [Chloroflexota bacterium]MDA1270385.1 DAK2 domain-containing protein [Chloroflexota bacterium]
MDQTRGHALKQAFAAATACLEQYRDTVNSLNVFPVPDGDTGTNMLLTMRAAVRSVAESCPDGRDYPISAVSAALAHGAFFGARGNSGVILSQFFKGFADALAGKDALAPADLVLAFGLASDAAYKSVGDPVEGTMLTVIRMASEAVQGSGKDILGLWQTAFQASRDALDRTPQQLPVLREAGVVDAGGLGMVVLLGGVLQSLSGVPLDLDLSRFQAAGKGAGPIQAGFLEATLQQEWGFCTQFIISGQDLDPDLVRGHFMKTALSTAVVGDRENVRVHIHVEDTGPALTYAGALGMLSEIKIEDMDRQNQTFASGGHVPAGHREPASLALLPVVAGEGLAHMFRESGCAAVIEGGSTMNPSVQQILDAARRAGATDVIVLPNNANVVLAAEQAAAADRFIHVVPTKNIPQGVAALLAFNPEGSWQGNVQAMTAALADVASVEITRAVRGVTIGGVAVAEGQFIGILEDELITASDNPESALRTCLDRAGLSSDAIVTIYLGAGSDAGGARSTAEALANEFPGIQVDLIDGGQPNSRYLASVE